MVTVPRDGCQDLFAGWAVSEGKLLRLLRFPWEEPRVSASAPAAPPPAFVLRGRSHERNVERASLGVPWPGLRVLGLTSSERERHISKSQGEVPAFRQPHVPSSTGLGRRGPLGRCGSCSWQDGGLDKRPQEMTQEAGASLSTHTQETFHPRDRHGVPRRMTKDHKS